ncbi:hypothetical protein D6T64_11910 [Cryobacterium melibiosiphilum]|uniref:Uncharacterized protein n=1 Tax=Cryobacterium melibiosiphilum TaxID=995039 RepID=A0A3A5MLV1_9MICO|nr:hypothetical protein [Cryobacterium melibiosiphilum]RJT88088.1 hypothetical protein D6T64_11910 [Cryobacterium melibiosiphilum]
MHRLVIDSWPTPDGKPFKDQPEEVWQAAVEHYCGGGEGAWPSWLPESLDITEWMPDEGDYGTQLPEKTGDPIGEYSELVMVVPRAPRRKFYFVESAAQKVLADLAEWGVVGHIETSNPVEWPTDEREQEPNEH